MEEIISITPTSDRMAINTVNKHLNRTSSLFDWACRHGYLTMNYFTNLTIRKKRKASEERKVFSTEQLERLLSGKQYQGKKPLHSYYYWLPLLGLYTGCRLDELCQLYIEDIYQIDDVWVIDINDSEDKKLKSFNSKRIIPIHSKLIDLGFLNYVDKIQAAHKRLFPALKKGRDGYGSAPSKWFARYRKQVGITESGVVFHSLRHTFVNELKQLGIEESLAASLAGHSSSGITFERYGKDYSPSVLKDVIERLNYTLPDIKALG